MQQNKTYNAKSIEDTTINLNKQPYGVGIKAR